MKEGNRTNRRRRRFEKPLKNKDSNKVNKSKEDGKREEEDMKERAMNVVGCTGVVCVVISAGRERPSSAVHQHQHHHHHRKETTHFLARPSLHQQKAKRSRTRPFVRASISLFFQRRFGDPQAAVRTRCVHTHFANVLQRHETARIRQGGEDLRVHRVVGQIVSYWRKLWADALGSTQDKYGIDMELSSEVWPCTPLPSHQC